jgi:hypothetical protein
MRLPRYSALLAAASVCLASQPAAAAIAAPPPPPAPSTDSLIFSANGSTLTGANGGGGGSLTWLHDFNSGVLGVAGEYQRLANAHWAFGSLSGSVNTGDAAAKWTFSGDAHLGSGDISLNQGAHHFNYQVEGAGVAGTFDGRVTVQLQAHHYHVDTSHGILPKVGLGVLWTRHLQTTVSYSRSVTGNLGTEIETLQINHYGSALNWLIGGAAGHVAPPVVNLYTGLTGAAPQLREGYLGLSKSFGHTDWSILADYLRVASQTRITLTLVCTLHMG